MVHDDASHIVTRGGTFRLSTWLPYDNPGLLTHQNLEAIPSESGYKSPVGSSIFRFIYVH